MTIPVNFWQLALIACLFTAMGLFFGLQTGMGLSVGKTDAQICEMAVMLEC